jgi:transcriptional regulator with PAS, ATPase and Fis domain
MKQEWFDSLGASITVCDEKGIISYMNEKAAESLSKYGGFKLLGSNLLDCHNEDSRKIIQEMLENASENIYTTEKNGIKKFICQKPVFEKGKFAGIIEITMALPKEMKHFNRD